MGVLTQEMTRLRDEIVSSSHARMALRGTLIRQTEQRRAQVFDLCAAFARNRAGAHRAWSECAADAAGRNASQGRNLVAESGDCAPLGRDSHSPARKQRRTSEPQKEKGEQDNGVGR